MTHLKRRKTAHLPMSAPRLLVLSCPLLVPVFRLLVLVLVLVTCVLMSRNAQAELRAGASKVEITPSMGISLDGSISKNGPATSVHDPLHARALVLDDGSTKLAIVVVDQCMTGRDVFDAAKQRIREEIGIPENRILMAATHTHAAPRTIHIGRDPIDDQYHERLAEWIAEAVVSAQQNLAPAAIGYASFLKPELVACRRHLSEPGSVGANPFGDAGERVKSVAGRSNAIIGPAGPTDPQFSVLSVRHRDQTPLCLLGNFSVHYCGGYRRGAVSADYFGHFSHAVETLLPSSEPHPPMLGIMSNGTSGDTGAFQSPGGKKYAAFESMQFHGRMLAEEAAQAIENIPYRSDVSLQMVEDEITLDVRRPEASRIAWAKRVLAEPDTKRPHRWTKIYAEEALHLADHPPTQSIKLQAIRIGEIGIAAAPCEVFAETGLAIKKHSPLRYTFNMELANGYGGYLPTREQHDLGGYETWPARSSKLEVDAEEKIRQTLIGLLRDLH